MPVHSSPFMIPVTDDAFHNRLVNYAMWNYGDLLEKVAPSYPYEIIHEDKRMLEQVAIWFSCKMKNPSTGITMLEEFVERFVKNKRSAAKYLQLKDMEYCRFKVLGKKDELLMVVSVDEGIPYRTRVPWGLIEMLDEGVFFRAFIHPWDEDGTHMLFGRVDIEE